MCDARNAKDMVAVRGLFQEFVFVFVSSYLFLIISFAVAASLD